MDIGLRFSEIKVDGDLIIDGHHRYIASLFANVEMERVASIKTSATEITEWKLVTFDSNDWDTEAQIDEFNKNDADFNAVSVSEILNKLK
jgi:hypothetical protein